MIQSAFFQLLLILNRYSAEVEVNCLKNFHQMEFRRLKLKNDKHSILLFILSKRKNWRRRMDPDQLCYINR